MPSYKLSEVTPFLTVFPSLPPVVTSKLLHMAPWLALGKFNVSEVSNFVVSFRR